MSPPPPPPPPLPHPRSPPTALGHQRHPCAKSALMHKTSALQVRLRPVFDSIHPDLVDSDLVKLDLVDPLQTTFRYRSHWAAVNSCPCGLSLNPLPAAQNYRD